MNKPENPFCLIKFGKKHHLESLLEKGELFFNTTTVFNKSTNTNTEQGDENEGAKWIKNVQLAEIKVNHPTLGEFKFKSVPNKLSKLTQFNHNYLTCSFYIITTKDFENTNTLKIDKKMLEFGEYALIINNPKTFIDSLIKTLENKKISYVAQKVEYKDLEGKGEITMNPFVKKNDHLHQKEYRIVLKNQFEPKSLHIKGMKENGKIVLSKYIIESEWTVERG